MRILFIHQNFPGQFIHLASQLVKKGFDITSMSINKPVEIPGVRHIVYTTARGSTKEIHPWVGDFETKIIRGEAAYKAALVMRSKGYRPDLIVAHPGWGESLFLKDVWPNAKLAIYSEFYYHFNGADVNFDPEFPPQDIGDSCKIKIKNINQMLHFDIADAGLSPTQWQANQYPESFRRKITVIHDGVNTESLQANDSATYNLPNGRMLSKADCVITFVNRNLEPYRGYHSFMRALPIILAEHPSAQICIVGGDGVSYGAKHSSGLSWKEIYLNEVVNRLDVSRVHFLGKIPYKKYISLLQISSAHVYLTYPFVLSWSLIEAMSMRCPIIGSSTAPVVEVIDNERNGLLVDFFDYEDIARKVSRLITDKNLAYFLGANARSTAVERYDLKNICIPMQLQWIQSLVDSK